nr:leucine-rich repeat domain-containing protein [Treponema sp.]
SRRHHGRGHGFHDDDRLVRRAPVPFGRELRVAGGRHGRCPDGRCGYIWACAPATPGGSTNIDISAASGDSTTVSGSLGTATVRLTASYDGTACYTKNIGFEAIYSFALADLRTGLASILGTSADKPVKIMLTAPLTSTADISTLRSALSNNSSVFVDLSEVEIAEGVNPVDLSYRSNLVVPPEIPSTVTKLNLYGTGITDVSALSLPTGLQELNLSNCSGVTDWSGLSLPAGLQKLFIGSMPDLTSLAVVNPVSECQRGNLLGLKDKSL